MGFRFAAVVVCVLASFATFAQQDAPSSPPASDQMTNAPEKPSSTETHIPKLDLTPDANGKLSEQQMQELFRVVADKDMENQKRERDYTYIEHEIDNNLDGKGEVKSTEIKTYEVLEIYGEQVQRLIEKGDKPLSAKDAAKEE